MYLVAETPHLPEYRVLDGYEEGGEAAPEVKEDEDSNKQCNDGDSVAKEEDEDLPLLHPSPLHVQRVVQAVRVVCVFVPGTIGKALFCNVV